mgnify:CR=1 FL=1
MIQPIRYSGGQSVKASTLQRGDYIRDPKRPDKIMVVAETGATIFVRGLTEDNIEKHYFLDKSQMVTKVTNVTTENVVPLKEGTGQE